jgi:hypothetical protein
MCFKSFQILVQNPNVLAFGFTEKCEFLAKKVIETPYFLFVTHKF